MCKAVDWYVKMIDCVDRHKAAACMIAGFVVAWWAGEKFDKWNDKLVKVMHEQTEVQLATARALQELTVRVGSIERKLEQ